MLDRFAITDIERIIFVGENEYPEKVNTYSNFLINYELIYKINGEITLNFNGKQYNIDGGTVFILPKGDNKEYIVERKKNGSCIDIFFQCNEQIISEVFIQKVASGGKIETLFNRAFSVWAAKNDGYYFECLSIIYNILYELKSRSYISKDKLSKIKPALDYINQHFTEKNISCESLAEKCDISYSYLKELFLEQYKLTPNKYILKMKINYACDLLKEGNYSITQIALLCGFSDVYYFCRYFKKRGCLTNKSEAAQFFVAKKNERPLSEVIQMVYNVITKNQNSP